jgi:hypothetical protein
MADHSREIERLKFAGRRAELMFAAHLSGRGEGPEAWAAAVHRSIDVGRPGRLRRLPPKPKGVTRDA